MIHMVVKKALNISCKYCNQGIKTHGNLAVPFISLDANRFSNNYMHRSCVQTAMNKIIKERDEVKERDYSNSFVKSEYEYWKKKMINKGLKL